MVRANIVTLPHICKPCLMCTMEIKCRRTTLNLKQRYIISYSILVNTCILTNLAYLSIFEIFFHYFCRHLWDIFIISGTEIVTRTVYSFGGWKPKIKALVSSEGPLPSPQPAICSLSSHGRRDEGALCGLFYKGTNPVHEGTIFMTQSLPEDLTSKNHHIGDSLSTYELEVGAWGEVS